MDRKSLKLLKKRDSAIRVLNTLFDAVATKIGALLLISIFLGSCGERAPVNEQYLQSEDYKQFRKNQQKEQTLRVKNRRSLQKFLTAFAECDLENEQSLPMQFDRRILEMEAQSCEYTSNNSGHSFTASDVGYSEWRNIIIRWILLRKKSVYEDAELFAVTYRNNSLIGFQTVGVFKKNLRQNFSTNITVAEHDDYVLIESVMDRGLKYPFKYDNVTRSVFQIDTAGTIEQLQGQSESYQSLPKFFKELHHCDMGKQWMLPLQIDEGTLSEAISCEKMNSKFQTNFTARSVGYTIFKGITVRLFDMKSDLHSDNHLMMAGAFKDSKLVSFQTVGTFRRYSPSFVTDIDIWSSIRIHQKGDSLYISSSIIRDRSFPIKQADSTAVQYAMGTDGNIREM